MSKPLGLTIVVPRGLSLSLFTQHRLEESKHL